MLRLIDELDSWGMVERRLSEIPGPIPNEPISRTAFWRDLAVMAKAGHAGRKGEDDAMLG